MSQRDRVAAVIMALGVVAFVAVRLHVLDDDFPNPDIAGIVYNAELLLGGDLPYVETLEIKPPGAFCLVALGIAALGRSLEAIQLVYATWLGVGAYGVWLAARAVHADADEDVAVGHTSAALAAMVALLAMGMFSYNYSGWMTPASAISVGAALKGLRNRGRAWGVLAGAAACLAVVTIQRAAVLGLLLPGLFGWARRRGWAGATASAPAAWIAGASAMALLVALPWLWAGETTVLVSAIAPWGTAREYSAASAGGDAGLLFAVALQLFGVFWFPVGMMAVAVLAAFGERRASLAGWIPGVLWLLLSIVAAGMGGLRFYLHYLVQYAPALGLLAGHPALLRRLRAVLAQRSEERIRDGVVVTLVLALVIGQLLEIGLGRGHRYESMARRLERGRTAAQAAGEHIRNRTRPDETIAVWGWTAWPVYYWSERRSATRIYKPLGTLTTFNTNTELELGEGPRFRPGPAVDEFIAAFDHARPAYFVYSPSMVHAFNARPDPLEAFTALRQRLQAGYVMEALYGDLRLFRRVAD